MSHTKACVHTQYRMTTLYSHSVWPRFRQSQVTDVVLDERSRHRKSSYNRGRKWESEYKWIVVLTIWWQKTPKERTEGEIWSWLKAKEIMRTLGKGNRRKKWTTIIRNQWWWCGQHLFINLKLPHRLAQCMGLSRVWESNFTVPCLVPCGSQGHVIIVSCLQKPHVNSTLFDNSSLPTHLYHYVIV